LTIHEVVPILAELLERSPLPRSARQAQATVHLKAIPDYLARHRLDAWEEDFPWESTQDGSAIAPLLKRVYELGCYNLYTMFNPQRTLREYATVCANFLEVGIVPPVIEEITDW
jgi:hypothetical protein